MSEAQNWGESARPSVLLVDDDLNNLTRMATAFDEQGWETTLARGAVAALKHVEARSFELVVTEVIMPDKDGIELIMALKAKDLAMPVLAISGGGRLPAGQALRLAEALGAAASLGKPLCNDALLALATSLIELA
jgi:DNA-binding NtrC family response regulator